MEEKYADVPWIGPEYFENQRNFPNEELMKFAGKHIAWSWDGSRILTSGDSDRDVYDKVRAAGFDPSRVIFDYVDLL